MSPSPTEYSSKSIANPDQILQVKDNGVFSAWNYASKLSGGKRIRKKRASTRRYKRGKVGKGRRTRRRA